MKKNYPRFFKYLNFTFLVGAFCFFQLSSAQDKTSTEAGNWQEINWSPTGLPTPTDNVTLSHSLVIQKDSIVEINNLYIGQSGGITVNGTLIINGNLETDNNLAYFEMGDSAKVIIYGDFLASNKVDVTVSSYLIIYGNFTKKGSDGQGEFQVDNGNIYVFGDVSGWPNFSQCDQGENYTGTPTQDGSCDYGTKDDFDNNSGGFPEDLKELIPCLVNYEWTGAADSDWNNPANWSCDSIPAITNNVTIPGGLNIYPIINPGINALAKNLQIEPGASVVVNDNWLRIFGNYTNSGVLNAETGSISFEGTSAQTIPSGAFYENRILNLRINNSEGVTSEAVIEILNSLKVESGTFTTANSLTLISDVSGTAFIDGSGSGEITGTLKMQRYLSNGFGYKYFSTPFSNSTVADFSGFMDLSEPTTGFPHFYQYKEDRKDSVSNHLTGWQAYILPGNTLNIAKGYALNISADTIPVDVEILGEVNNGPVNILLQNSNGLYTKGFNLVGNPYPSPLDWDLISPSLTGIDKAVYFFRAGNNNRYTGTYTSYVNGVSTGVTSIIPSMQGFFVRVSEPGNATLSFTNAARTGNQVTQGFYKTKNHRIIPQIKLTAGFSGGKASDAAVIYFNAGATADFEKDLDAFKLLNTDTEVPSLYSLTNKKEKLSINAISSAETQEIPLGIKTEKTGKMFIKLANVENIFPLAYIYLKDYKNKQLHDFSNETSYSFTSQKGETNNRFSLIFSSEKLSENEMKLQMEYFSVYSAAGEILVKLNLPKNTSGNVILSNISGQVLQKKSGKEKEELRFRGLTAPGIYLVSLELENERFTKKILLKK